MLFGLPTPARADDLAHEAFTRWMAQHGVTRGTLAVTYRDGGALVRGYGGLRGEQRVLVASLSKPITAVCTASLIQQGKLRLDTTVGELLDLGVARYGQPRDARLRRVTVEHLLTHRAGFGRDQEDPATGTALGDLLRQRPLSHVTMRDLVPAVLRSSLEREPGAVYVYSNASYLMLGVAIEAITGRTYEDYCGAQVLKAQGITKPRLHRTWEVLGSFGGWELSGPEYLAFLRVFAPSGGFLTAETRHWMLSAAGKELAPASPLFYSLLVVRSLPGGSHNFFHDGHWEYRLAAGSASGPLTESLGSLAVSAAFGAAWFAYYEPRPDAAARLALDRELYRAVEASR